MFKPPLILFLDDGVNVYHNVGEAERSLENADARENPHWCGFDSEERGFRFAFEEQEPRKFLGLISIRPVKFQPDPNLTIEGVSDTIREQMIDFLAGMDSNPNGFARYTNKELFRLVVQRSPASSSTD